MAISRLVGRDLHLALLGLALATSPTPLRAQHAWTLVAAPHVDLWFHGLAVVGFGGFGPLPLYDPGYAARTRHVKDSLGLGQTALDRQAQRLHDAFEADSGFEALHFLPLYFVAADRQAMLEGLRAAPPPVLRAPEQHRVFREFVDALDSEWREFYGAYWTRQSAERAARVGALQTMWDARFAPALTDFLTSARLEGGVILLSPALGADGRILEANNVVAVRFPTSSAGDDPLTPLYAAVRELCYPAARRLVATTMGEPADRVTAERSSGIAAVRCGALLLARRSTELARGYETAFLKVSGSHATFEAAYPLKPRIRDRLLQLVEAR